MPRSLALQFLQIALLLKIIYNLNVNKTIEKARSYVLWLLTIRQRSKKEISDKLKRKDYGEEIIKNIIRELEKSGLIDDRKFSLSWVKSRLETKPAGKNLLKRELLSKGIDRNLADEIIGEVFSVENEEEIAYNLANKRWKQYSKLDKIVGARRLYSFLARRGFGFEIAEKITRRIINE